MPEDCCLEGLGEGDRIDAGDRDVGAEPVDDERRQREPDPLLELLGLGEGAEIEIGGKLLGGGNHCISPWAPGHSAPGRGPAARPKMGRRAGASAATGPRCGLAARSAPSAAAPARRSSPRWRPALALPVLALFAAVFLRLASSAASTFFSISVNRAAGLLDRRLGLGAGVIDGQRQLGLQLALAQQAHAVQRTADETGRHQRRDVHGLAGIDHAWHRPPPAGGRG